MATEKIRVGIIGANARYGWGSSAHIPALRAIPEFEITAICTSRPETAAVASKHFGIPLAFSDSKQLIEHPEVDLVSICVRVPYHYQMGMAALNAGKHVFCEWPLAATTEQAQAMSELALRSGVHHMVGLQARGAPVINRVKQLIAEGYIGQVLACSMIVTTPNWGSEFSLSRSYLADRSSGATLLTIPGGHSIDALCYCLGEFEKLSAVVASKRTRVRIVETGETIQMTSPDQVIVAGVLTNGAVASVHIKGGTSNGTGLSFEIHGTDGDLIVAPKKLGPAVSVQISELSLRGSQGRKPLEELPIPDNCRWVPSAVPPGPPFNVAQLFVRMAQGIKQGKHASPGFEAAVQRHRLLDGIEQAAATGIRQTIEPSTRQAPA
jgi:predicted dehydrogenase